MTWRRGLFTLQNLRTQKVNVNIPVTEIMMSLYWIISDIYLCTQTHVSMFQTFIFCILCRLFFFFGSHKRGSNWSVRAGWKDLIPKLRHLLDLARHELNERKTGARSEQFAQTSTLPFTHAPDQRRTQWFQRLLVFSAWGVQEHIINVQIK